jgi:hypothetical protein
MPISTCTDCGGQHYWRWEEAFDKFGFGDGDGQVMTHVVADVLRAGGYVVTAEPWGLHNITICSIKRDGTELIPFETITYGYDNPRKYLPKEVTPARQRAADRRESRVMSSARKYLTVSADVHRALGKLALGGLDDRQTVYNADGSVSFSGHGRGPCRLGTYRRRPGGRTENNPAPESRLMKRRASFRTFQVRFRVTDVYSVTVKAADTREAVGKAKDLYRRYGEDADHGIHMDPFEGGVHGWHAQEVTQ